MSDEVKNFSYYGNTKTTLEVCDGYKYYINQFISLSNTHFITT